MGLARSHLFAVHVRPSRLVRHNSRARAKTALSGRTGAALSHHKGWGFGHCWPCSVTSALPLPDSRRWSSRARDELSHHRMVARNKPDCGPRVKCSWRQSLTDGQSAIAVDAEQPGPARLRADGSRCAGKRCSDGFELVRWRGGRSGDLTVVPGRAAPQRGASWWLWRLPTWQRRRASRRPGYERSKCPWTPTSRPRCYPWRSRSSQR